MLVWGRGILTELSLCYSIVYYYNGAQCYEQLLQVDRLDRASIFLGLAFCLLSTSVSSVFVVRSLHFSEPSLIGLTLTWLTKHCPSVL